jgi:hypothetical protein
MSMQLNPHVGKITVDSFVAKPALRDALPPAASARTTCATFCVKYGGVTSTLSNLREQKKRASKHDFPAPSNPTTATFFARRPVGSPYVPAPLVAELSVEPIFRFV